MHAQSGSGRTANGLTWFEFYTSVPRQNRPVGTRRQGEAALFSQRRVIRMSLAARWPTRDASILEKIGVESRFRPLEIQRPIASGGCAKRTRPLASIRTSSPSTSAVCVSGLADRASRGRQARRDRRAERAAAGRVRPTPLRGNSGGNCVVPETSLHAWYVTSRDAPQESYT